MMVVLACRGLQVVQVPFQDSHARFGMLAHQGDAQVEYLVRAMAAAGVDLSTLRK